MDPLSAAQTLLGVARYLYEVSAKMKENKEECRRLCAHVEEMLKIIQEAFPGGVSEGLNVRLCIFHGLLQDIAETIADLVGRSLLKQAIWRNSVSDKILKAYDEINTLIREFNLHALIDINRMHLQSEEARRIDSFNAKQAFERILNGNEDILSQLQVQKQQMQEVMLSIHHHLAKLPTSYERDFLERSLQAMQCRCGRLGEMPDEFMITSLDVIVHRDRKLGAGGFAEVFLADWRGTRVAVKILERGLPASTVEKEVNVWKRLRHPNILPFFGSCPIADPPFMVSAYQVNGDAIRYLHRFPQADRLRVLCQASQGLDYLHHNNVIHGDIKGTNILIDQYGNACLSDFGLSLVRSHTASIRNTLPAPQLGTVRWMSPEHMTSQPGVPNKKTDIYSFAMTMYEVFTGLPPFSNSPDIIILTMVYEKGMRPLRPAEHDSMASGLDDAVWTLISSCWSQDPNERMGAPELSETLLRHCNNRIKMPTPPITTENPIEPLFPVPCVPDTIVREGDSIMVLDYSSIDVPDIDGSGGQTQERRCDQGPYRSQAVQFPSVPKHTPQSPLSPSSEVVQDVETRIDSSGPLPEDKTPTRVSDMSLYEVDLSPSKSDDWFSSAAELERDGDNTAAIEGYQMGAAQGRVRCLHRLGTAHLLGQLSLKVSANTGLSLLRQAADLASVECPQPGFVWAAVLSGHYPNVSVADELLLSHIPVDSTPQSEARRYLEQAAAHDFGPALYHLAQLYESSVAPFGDDPVKSFEYYSKASQFGIAEAYMGMSRWFLCGAQGPRGFSKDRHKARECARRAAGAQLPIAEFAMGYYDEAGIGGPVNFESACRWYTIAASHGYKKAGKHLRTLKARLEKKQAKRQRFTSHPHLVSEAA